MLIQKPTPPDTEYPSCSFTMVTDTYAVTAAHCVYRQTATGWEMIPGLTDRSQALALLRQPVVGSRNATACFAGGNSANCKFFRATVTQVYPPNNLAWPTKVPVPNPDIAILQLKFINAATLTPAALLFDEPPTVDITLAGYGYTTDKLVGWPNGSLLVGWQFIDTVDNYGMRWVVSAAQRTSNACPGDSGGAIFAGDQFGVLSEHHQLEAVISKVDTPNNENARLACLTQAGYGVRVAEYKEWICKTLPTPLAACSQ